MLAGRGVFKLLKHNLHVRHYALGSVLVCSGSFHNLSFIHLFHSLLDIYFMYATIPSYLTSLILSLLSSLDRA
jgi:hypothetical protein